MKLNSIFILCFVFFLLGSCSDEKTVDTTLPNDVEQKLQKLSEILTTSEKNDDLESFLACYDKNVISMPEYQLTLDGINEIAIFYKEIFQRQKIKTFQRTASEIINLGKTIIEIGTFKKEYTGSNKDTILTQNGKYWNIWHVQQDGSFKLKGEAFGFFHPVANPEALTVDLKEIQPDESAITSHQKIPFELKAYNALMEKGVRNRDGILRSEIFMSDGSFMPFADSTVTGMEEIKSYLIAYSNMGEVTIDSISVYTYQYEYLEEYILEYPMFRVKWSTPQHSERTEGKGIRIWKRQEDKSLRLYREIGTHNHLK